jgi:hypothetical protein
LLLLLAKTVTLLEEQEVTVVVKEATEVHSVVVIEVVVVAKEVTEPFLERTVRNPQRLPLT